MCHLKLRPLAADDCEVFAPVELEGLARAKRQRNEGATPRALPLALVICPPNRRENDPRIVFFSGSYAQKRQPGCRNRYSRAPQDRCASASRCAAPCAACWLPSSATPRVSGPNGSSLLGRSGVEKLGSIVPAFKYFLIPQPSVSNRWRPTASMRDSPVRCAISRMGRQCRNLSFLMKFKSPMSITPLSPRRSPRGRRVTWVKSQWKLSDHPGQFSVQINSSAQ